MQSQYSWSPVVATETTPRLRKTPVCSFPGCPNKVYARQHCVKHGGRATCQAPDCPRNARRFGFCWLHDTSKGPRTQCKMDGCEKAAHKHRLCARHGGAQKCKVSGCEAYARSKGVCQKHLRETEGEDEMSLDMTLDDIQVFKYFMGAIDIASDGSPSEQNSVLLNGINI
ncbi:Aste57867_13041 [Aphanomyces stellatus]|uniref:Aste57867_13017 protein n=1 Tax=Aphanomyces stellatus TaxID=120398 RepID=A0A485KI50_9STRA|nr:hypothetical protein As57867_012993 [Aphanomyces stellatus]KAF0696224.1 hypothetical protein As57867_012969 [Aphanomyces stellatus]KAF0704580.1 hypothetical protein As57867_007292 [Aphanomyces stellatus]VFT84237.1 Aste57867_7318 [Aphanomyces stellatus]VFT89862.1 Aste57867_13017 [Aphanomyces stellatus]